MDNFFFNILRNLPAEIIGKVLPEVLLSNHVSIVKGDKGQTIINEIELDSNSNIFVVGFGKGAYRLAQGLNDQLGQLKVTKAVISIPEDQSYTESLPSEYCVIKAAPINIPDNNSVTAGSKIVELLSELRQTDLLIVLVTGGGSALATYPVPGLTISDIRAVVQALHSAGAPIHHLNAVRQQFDLLKAGGLAALAYPVRVLSFVLSDVIGSNLEVIASGPTVLEQITGGESLSFQILQQYKLLEKLPKSITQFLNLSPEDPLSKIGQIRKLSKIPAEIKDISSLQHVKNVLIGSNLDALNAAKAALLTYGLESIIIDAAFSGEASNLGIRYADLSANVCLALLDKARNAPRLFGSFDGVLNCSELHLFSRIIAESNSEKHYRSVALIAGGETTVAVKGTGKGGRNQEAALSASIRLHELWSNQMLENCFSSIIFFSTDGQDGPTTATGAIATPYVVSQAVKDGLDPQLFLCNNDSFTFWNLLARGNHHIITGRTGTNVADLVIIIVGVLVD